MSDLLILPKLDTVNKPPPKEAAKSAGLKMNVTKTFQHIYKQSKKMVQRPELKPKTNVHNDDTETIAKSDWTENASDLYNGVSQSETVTLPVNQPGSSPILSNTEADGKEGKKDDQIKTDNRPTNPSIANLDGSPITITGTKINLLTGIKQDDMAKGAIADNGKLNAPEMPEKKASGQQDIHAMNISIDKVQVVDNPIISNPKVLDGGAKQAQVNSSNMVLNDNADTPHPEEQNGRDINLKITSENNASQHQNLEGSNEKGNTFEISAKTQNGVNNPGIMPQRPVIETLQTLVQIKDSYFEATTGNNNFEKEGQSKSTGNETGVNENNGNITGVNPKSIIVNNSGSITIEEGKVFLPRADGLASFEKSMVVKTTEKSKDDPPPENVQTGVSNLVMPQSKATEPARLAEAPRNEILQQLSKDLEDFTKSRQQSLRLQLHPESLGKIDLHLISNEGGVRIVMNADQAATGFMLERHLGELKEMLEQAGVNLTGLSVNTGNGHSYSNGNFQNSSSHFASFSSKNNPLIANREKKVISTPLVMDHDYRVDYRI